MKKLVLLIIFTMATVSYAHSSDVEGIEHPKESSWSKALLNSLKEIRGSDQYLNEKSAVIIDFNSKKVIPSSIEFNNKHLGINEYAETANFKAKILLNESEFIDFDFYVKTTEALGGSKVEYLEFYSIREHFCLELGLELDLFLINRAIFLIILDSPSMFFEVVEFGIPTVMSYGLNLFQDNPSTFMRQRVVKTCNEIIQHLRKNYNGQFIAITGFKLNESKKIQFSIKHRIKSNKNHLLSSLRLDLLMDEKNKHFILFLPDYAGEVLLNKETTPLIIDLNDSFDCDQIFEKEANSIEKVYL